MDRPRNAHQRQHCHRRLRRYLNVNEPSLTSRTDELAALRARVGERAHSGDRWVVVGGLPLGVTPTFCADLIHVIEAAGAWVILDTSRW